MLISNGTFLLDGVRYELEQNNGTNSLHGGLVGFDKVFWKFIEEKSSNQSLYFEDYSKDMEGGFPGNLVVGVGGTTITTVVGAAASVGIGDASPSYMLDVAGAINSQTDVKVNGVSVTEQALNDAVAMAIALG